MSGVVTLIGAAAVAAAVGSLYVRANGRFRPVDRSAERLTSGDIGAALGAHATLVQFSSAFCTPCRATRQLLSDIAGRASGVAHVEIDAESNLDLVRRLSVLRTPTVLVLDSGGRIRHRATGLPTRQQVDTVLTGVS